MRLKPLNSAILLIVGFTIASAITVNAQEDKPGELDSPLKESMRNDADPVLSDSEFRTGKPPTLVSSSKETVKDSAATVVPVKFVKPVKNLEKATEKAQKEEDPLSFNFLYYIIEKFKLSDIIE